MIGRIGARMRDNGAVTERLAWHPLTLAAGIAAAAAGAAAADLAGSAPGHVSLWLVMGAAAGFATSGSV